MSLILAAVKPSSVLIATDFSQASEKPLRHALAIARFYGSKFCLAHVVSSPGLTMAGPSAIAGSEEAASEYAARLQDSLARTGVLGGIRHKFVIRQGELWPELLEIVRQENADLIVLGTHGRNGLGKLFFGSVAEQVFRQAGCPVLSFGPRSCERPWIGDASGKRTFLFATDFGDASLHGLPRAIATANEFGAKLVLLHVIPGAAVPQSMGWHTAEDLSIFREDTRTRTLRRLEALIKNVVLDVQPEFAVEFSFSRPISESILQAAEKLRADLIIMGLHYSVHTGVMSRLGLSTAYEVICDADSPVLTVNCSTGDSVVRPGPSDAANALLSQADVIRIHGLGVKWSME
ncbi:MAG TPA: universal stress protein [Terriglobales bacterium]|nr:universal stress protein [Terriglobales bacterium]